jgi:hypothetical protein
VSCVPAPACKAALAQATALWPNRSRASDGICPSRAHTKANPTSDHERGNAVDLTHDPANGCDAHAWARLLVARRDPRVTYVISDRQIANAVSVGGQPPWTWRRYNGSNPHTTHAHVSIKSTARNDTSPWFASAPEPEPLTPAPNPEDDMLIAYVNGGAAYLITGGRRILLHGSEIDRLKAVVPVVEAPHLIAATPDATVT